MKNFVLAGVEDARYMTLEYAEALRESGCYLEMDKNGYKILDEDWNKKD